ncbi:hypothetical protein EDB86DRAFT_3082576 [Lactarius hatsudake]|nr:hypothetical protein EDB86DRAFT_3082576 [Lactarius hatsudake]
MGMNERAAVYYREQQTLEAAIVLRDLLADGGNGHDEILRRRKPSSPNSASVPGEYIVETWPSLMWLPKPLQWFRPALTILLTMLEEIRANDTETYLDFFNGVKRRLEAGIAKEFAYALSASFSAGVDTTLSTIQWCLVAVVTYPDITARIQEELGRDRLPTFDDEGSLPYLVAFVKEVTRRVFLPQCLPRS